jgi:uncharacterized protein YjbI with pentapeptide repeats
MPENTVDTIRPYGDPITVYGGTFNFDPTNWVAEGFKVVANAGSYTVLFPQESFDSLIENAGAGDTVAIPAGTYTFPASKLEAGMTLNCAEGTVFEGKTSLNINGATVVGATFTSENAYLVYQQTVNGTFKDCVFTNSDGLRSCYAGGTVVFENCVFDTDFYGVHFDSGANDVTFKNCTFSGFNTFGAALTNLTLEGCTFKYNGKGGYNGINLWGNAELTDCTFVFDGSASYEWVDLVNDGKTVSFTNCVVTDGKTTKGIETVVGNYGDGNTIKINGKEYVAPKTVTYDKANDLQTVLNSLNSGDTLILPEGTYITSGTLAVPAGITVKGESGKVVVIHQNSAGQDDIFNCVGDVVIENITFESNRKGYAVAGNTKEHDTDGDITVIGCNFVGIAAEKNYGVYKNLNGNLTVKDCTFNNYNNAICGVNNGNGSTTVVSGCTFTNINGEAIGYVISSVPADFEANAIANNTGLTAENVIGY